uniref:Uncharacterized protein n=1 Tax=Oncorhynchus kisutch TaxID=8019 RepID=A0A8C7N541_ONCKI
MANIKTLNEIGHLNSSGFGRPWPRHGLYLLHWFSHNYVIFDNNGDLLALYNPKRKEFGFHHFDNRLECDGNCYQLLPNQNFPYYEVGNLNTPGAGDLPPYVSQNYKGHHDDSNMDRIIISLHPGLVLDKVYVTQHEDVRTFDRQNTYRISKGLNLFQVWNIIQNLVQVWNRIQNLVQVWNRIQNCRLPFNNCNYLSLMQLYIIDFL